MTPPEARLWRAVIARTVMDWLSGPPDRKLKAEKYLFEDTTYFPLVCQSAGLSVGKVRSRLNNLRSEASRKGILRRMGKVA